MKVAGVSGLGAYSLDIEPSVQSRRVPLKVVSLQPVRNFRLQIPIVDLRFRAARVRTGRPTEASESPGITGQMNSRHPQAR